MSLDLLPLGIVAAIAILIRLSTTLREAEHLRYAWDWICPVAGDKTNGRRSVVLERSFIALRAIRLARLGSLALLIPSCILIIYRLTEGNTSLQWGLITAFPFFLLLFGNLLVRIAMGDAYNHTRESRRNDAPTWLYEESEKVPGVVAAGALLWEWIMHKADMISIFSPDVEARPNARLYELEGELVMAVGESELDALEARSAAAAAAASGAVTSDKTAQDMIRSIRRLDTTLVREVMRPLNKVTAVALNGLTAEKFLKIAKRTGYTRFPCYNDQVTNLIGYLNVYDFLESPILPKNVRDLVHPCLFVPELAQVDMALQEMLRSKTQIAICYDEFGGCSGLLSREDIIEEITGEIMDEYDRPQTVLVREAHGHFLVDATIDLDVLEEAVGLELESKSADTLAGFIYQRLNRAPKRGDSLEEQGWRIDIFQMDRHVVRRVRLTPPAKEER